MMPCSSLAPLPRLPVPTTVSSRAPHRCSPKPLSASLFRRYHGQSSHRSLFTLRARDENVSDGDNDPRDDIEESSVVENTEATSPSIPTPGEKEDTRQQDEMMEGEEEATPPWKEDRGSSIRSLKAGLIKSVAGLDRGLVATAKDTARVRSLVENLETLSGSIDLTSKIESGISAQEAFNGTWKLIYTSAFNVGRRRRPSIINTPFTFGPVYQVIDVDKMELDNVVELLVGTLPQFPWSPSNVVPKIRLRLRHTMSFTMSIVSVNLKEVIVNILDTGFDWPSLTIPTLRELLRSLTGRKSDGEFSLVFMDEDIRITEGDRSEFRIFVKIPGMDP